MRISGKLCAFALCVFIVGIAYAETTDADKKTVASKAYVDTKQDIITTGLVTFHEPEENIDYTVPALVSYGTGTNNIDGVLGNKIGILGIHEGSGGLSSLGFLDLGDDSESAYLDNFVPTVRAVASALQNIWDNMPFFTPLNWNAPTHPNAINAYSTNFNGTTNNWPINDWTRLVNGNAFARALALKQNRISAGTDGNVVTYTRVEGEVGSVATANAPTYDSQTGALSNGTNIATIAAVDTRQKKMTCAGWDSDTHTDEHCWLWALPN